MCSALYNIEYLNIMKTIYKNRNYLQDMLMNNLKSNIF